MTQDPAALIVAVVGVLVATAALIVAIVAQRHAKNSATAARESAAAAKRSATAAEELTEIEKKKLHKDLTPELSVEAICQGPERVRLQIRLDGPNGLDRLDRLGVSVRDDKPRRPAAAGTTQAELDATVWGPYRFVPKVDDADAIGRIVPALPLARGESRTLVMEPSPVPMGAGTTESWRQQFADHPIRLEVTCQRAGKPLWRLPVDIAPPRPKLIHEAGFHSRNQLRVIVENVGNAPARDVRLSAPNDPTLTVTAEETPILEANHSIGARALTSGATEATWLELTWFDYLGVQQRSRVEFGHL